MSKPNGTEHDTKIEVTPRCGIVMPISEIDGCPKHHWAEVLAIVSSSVEKAGFEPNLVSEANEVGFINKRIVQNIYDNPIVVCDVSAKNPNVMFELGMRLAFDKPTIIMKDDKTTYSFDIGGIEHLPYPRDLRFASIVEFQQKLTEKIRATYQASRSDPNYTTFLKHFGEFVVAKLDHKEVSTQEFLLEELRIMRQSMASLERAQNARRATPSIHLVPARIVFASAEEAIHAHELIRGHPDVFETKVIDSDVPAVEFICKREDGSRLMALFEDHFGVKRAHVRSPSVHLERKNP